jgi:hypothetical protein
MQVIIGLFFMKAVLVCVMEEVSELDYARKDIDLLITFYKIALHCPQTD